MFVERRGGEEILPLFSLPRAVGKLTIQQLNLSLLFHLQWGRGRDAKNTMTVKNDNKIDFVLFQGLLQADDDDE
jgi:hypothetical protein